jgi:hypothetical protein
MQAASSMSRRLQGDPMEQPHSGHAESDVFDNDTFQ